MALAVASDVEVVPVAVPADDLSGGMKLYLSEEVAEARYHVIGAEMQVVNLSLNTGESVEVSPGAMMHHGPNIYASPSCSCSCGRYCTGESNVKINFTNKGSDPETIGLTPVYPAKIIPVHLNELGAVIVRATSYMCSVGQVDIDVSFGGAAACRAACPVSGSFGSGFRGRASRSCRRAGGTVLEKTLAEGESIAVDQDSVVGWQESVALGAQTFAGVCGCCSVCFGGEGCLLATFTGPGKIYITSMSFAKWHKTLAPNISEMQGRGKGAEGGEDGGGE
eukprot:CAMPEP_0171648550 /NCGR_PEP_ID=MMETSP0990-20121206/36198_1 /TAXON_ID=483369 /ORGANISM="non described non described, Strain CCMP2098" /LENGTH=278 /DNA_ID=CAMNT_0012226145 /DNA_START=15 /DNA_END=852 /DNA_ORIENTATION=-